MIETTKVTTFEQIRRRRRQDVELVQIDFACNDPDSGNFAGIVEAIQLPALSLELAAAQMPAPQFSIDETLFRFDESGHFIAWPHCGRASWVGNWCWEGVWMRIPNAVNFLIWLRTKRWFSADAGWSELFDWWREAELPNARLERLLMDAASEDLAA